VSFEVKRLTVGGITLLIISIDSILSIGLYRVMDTFSTEVLGPHVSTWTTVTGRVKQGDACDAAERLGALWLSLQVTQIGNPNELRVQTA
jgi:hypothetical protein